MSQGTIDRRAVVATLLKNPGDLLVVTGLGAASYDAGAAGDRPENFYLWGAMGGAVMIGLGLAIAQPNRRVLVITGDGDMLMGMGSLATVAAQAPDNFAVAVLDNGQFGETGGQRSHTSLTTDLAAVAAACGWPNVSTLRTMAEVEAIAPRLRRERLFTVIKISPAEVPRFLPLRDGAKLTARMHAALGIVGDP
jgi:thiamine pyrophosphate-dependent acetolactate synthase large subunit-like protein